MKEKHCILFFLFMLLATGCKKIVDENASQVFVRLFPSDTSYHAGGAFQLTDGNFILYGFPPENNQLAPLVIKCDAEGNILWQKKLSSAFHYCTIKPLSGVKLMAVGVSGSPSSAINVCEMDANGDTIPGTFKTYAVEGIKSGPLMPPRFETTPSGELLVAGTVTVNKDIYPFILPIDANGNASPVQVFTFDLPEGTQLMTRGLAQDEYGFTVTGATFRDNLVDTNGLVVFCLRLNTGYQELWHSIQSLPGASFSSKGAVSNGSSIVLYGSLRMGYYTNTGINDMIGTLYTRQIDLSGNVDSLTPFSNYPNLAHAGELIKTDDGFILAATTNEFSDIYLLSDNHIYLTALDNELHELWHQDFDGFHAFTAVSVSETKDGGYLIGGFEHSGTFLYSMCLIKTDAGGNIYAQ